MAKQGLEGLGLECWDVFWQGKAGQGQKGLGLGLGQGFTAPSDPGAIELTPAVHQRPKACCTLSNANFHVSLVLHVSQSRTARSNTDSSSGQLAENLRH